MSENVVLLVALALPVVIFALLRVNAALVFLSLCLGAVLTQYVGSEASTMMGMFAPKIGSASATTVDLVLLLAPAVATSVFTLLSVHGRLKILCNIVPALAASGLTLLLVVPRLPTALMVELQSQQVWKIVSKSSALIVGVGALVSLFFLWTQRSNFKHHDKRKH